MSYAQTSGKKQEVSMDDADWVVYALFDKITVEYKLSKCQDGDNNNEVWAVLRFTNTSNNSAEMNWSVKWERDGVCVNCDRISDDEFLHTLHFSPNQSIEGEACVTKDQRLYIFSNFVKRYPGMDSKKLTAFEFINVKVKEL
tara:strand:- start:16965 stop:17390 length:426 start_codon:yes stop_codon:yes gene_type:complete